MRTMEKLEELSLEFNQVNSELSKIVAEEHKLLEDVDDQKERFACNVQRLEKLNKEAQSNIKRSFMPTRTTSGLWKKLTMSWTWRNQRYSANP